MKVIRNADAYYNELMGKEWHPMYDSVQRVSKMFSGYTPSTIPSGQYMTIAQRYATDPIMARLPETVIDGWLQTICDTVAFIYLSTVALRIHKDKSAKERYTSDYAPETMFKILLELTPDSTAEEKFLIIDRIMNVTHPRGSLANLFIEGGEHALDEISGKNKQYGDTDSIRRVGNDKMGNGVQRQGKDRAHGRNRLRGQLHDRADKRKDLQHGNKELHKPRLPKKK